MAATKNYPYGRTPQKISFTNKGSFLYNPNINTTPSERKTVKFKDENDFFSGTKTDMNKETRTTNTEQG